MTEKEQTRLKKCRGCQSSILKRVYDFGPQPLAGEYPLEPESVRAAKRYPLDLTECAQCGLLQVTNIPPIEDVFHNDYRYSSSTVPDLVRHFRGYALFLRDRLPAGARVLEFGCNDGVLLTQLRDLGIECVGVDASDNVATLARTKGLDVRTGFLTPDFVTENGFAGGFESVTCSNVFAHIDDIRATTRAVSMLLKPSGLFNIEVHDGDVLVGEAQFDTVYHEHLTYFTEATLRYFVEAEGFDFVDCLRTNMHGGGLRFTCRKRTASETSRGLPHLSRIDTKHFAATIQRCSADVARLCAKYGPIDGYGAAGRAQMFINMTDTAYCFARVFDDSPFRQGRFIVGTDVPILPYGEERGDCCAILAWNYGPTIASRVSDNYKQVISLLPELKVWKG